MARRVKRKDALIMAMIALYKRRTASMIAVDLERFAKQSTESSQDMIRQITRGVTEFSGLEKLETLTRKQLKTLISFDWLRQSSSGQRHSVPRRLARGSMSSEEGESLSQPPPAAEHSPLPPFSAVSSSAFSFSVTSPRQQTNIERMLLRSGSLFSASAKKFYAGPVVESTPRPRITKEDLCNRVEDMAYWSARPAVACPL
jgi:hypothetical protein